MLGFLDGVVDGEARGWAVDPRSPELPVSVTILVEGKPVADTLALYQRSDVGEMLQSQGYHGYFIDLSHYGDTSVEVGIEAYAGDGSLLGNCPFRASIHRRSARSERTLLFLHIPKTAGSALRSAIERNYRFSELAHLYPDPMLFPAGASIWSLPLGQRRRLRFVAGHFYFGTHMAIPGPYDYATVLRDPIHRGVSQYFHYVQNIPESVSSGEKLLALPEVLERRDNVVFDNLMVRMLAGIDETQVRPGCVDGSAFDLALHNLRTQFTYVGFQESAADLLRVLNASYAWHNSPTLERENVGQWRMTAAEFDAARTSIEHFNRWDMLLYQRAREMFPAVVAPNTRYGSIAAAQ